MTDFQENSEHGAYYPSFFKIVIHTIWPLDNIKGLNQIVKGTLIHEQIHFIQDISSTYGLMNISATYNLIGYLKELISKNQTTVLELPLIFTPLINIKSFSDLKGDSSFIKDGSNIKFDDFSYIIKHCDNHKKAIITCLLDGNNVGSFEFGSICIKECMAHMIQEIIDPKIIHDVVPYRIAKIIAEKIYPEFAVEPLNIIALCSFSLYLPDCGSFYLDFLLKMKQGNYIPKKPTDIFDLGEAIRFDYNGITNIRDLHQSMFDSALEQIETYFGKIDLVKEKFNSFKKLFDDNPKILIEIISNLDFSIDVKIENLIEVFGFPQVSNMDESFFDVNRKNSWEWIHFSILKSVLNVVLEGHKTCSFYNDFCKYSKDKSCIDEFCLNRPWKKIGNISCPFTISWEEWGLDKFEILNR